MMIFYLLVTLLLSNLSAALRQSLQCYDLSDQRGDEVRAVEYIAHLSYYNFNNRINSCCFTGTLMKPAVQAFIMCSFSGIWILFENPHYNLGTPGARNWWGWGDRHCITAPGSFLNSATSLRSHI